MHLVHPVTPGFPSIPPPPPPPPPPHRWLPFLSAFSLNLQRYFYNTDLLVHLCQMPNSSLLSTNKDGKIIYDKDEKITYNLIAVTKLLHDCKEINRIITFLVHTTGGQPPRGTETVENRIRNGTRPRNIFLQHGKVHIALQYSKTSSTSGKDSTAIHRLPDRVGDLLLRYSSIFSTFLQR